MNNTNKLNESAKQMIESLFEYEVKNTKTKSASLQFAGKKLLNKKEHDYKVYFYTHFLKFYKKYSRNFKYEDFISVYSVCLVEACAALGDRFPDFETFKNDHKIQMEAMRYIKKTIEPLLYAENNPEVIKTKVKDKNVFVNRTETSLEAIQDAYKENEGEFELTESNRLFGSNADIDEDAYYEFNDVVKSFLENKNKVLTAKQLVFYDKMKDLYVDNNNGHITKKQMLNEAGLTQSQYYKYLENIEKRANQYYEDYGQKKSMSEDYRKGILRALNNYVKVVEDKAGVNIFKLNASRIVQDNYEEEAFEVIILKGLTTEEKQHVVRTVKGQHYLTHKIINKIYKNIKEYLKNNQLQHVKASEAKSTYTESLFTDEQKENVSSHYKIDAQGVTHAMDYGDIIESEVI